MKITVKQLQGSQCNLEVDPTTTILNIKQQIEKELKIPVESQRLLYLGKSLADEQPISFYPAIKDGSKLNLVVKTPDGLYEAALKVFKKLGVDDPEAAARKLPIVVNEKLDQMSIDDLNTLCESFLRFADGVQPLHSELDSIEE